MAWRPAPCRFDGFRPSFLTCTTVAHSSQAAKAFRHRFRSRARCRGGGSRLRSHTNRHANNSSLTDVCGVPKPVQVGVWIELIERARITSAGLSETAAPGGILALVKRLSGWRSDRESIVLSHRALVSDFHGSCQLPSSIFGPSQSSTRRTPSDSSKFFPYTRKVVWMSRCHKILLSVR